MKKKIVIALSALLVVFLLFIGGWFVSYYEAQSEAISALEGSANVVVINTPDYIAFYPSDTSTTWPGLIYYQGAKVAPEAYAVMAHLLAENGVPVVLIKMPVNFAIFDVSKGIDVKKELAIGNDWFIGGHSLGGAMASKVVYDNPDAFQGLILFASYPSGKSNDLSDRPLKVMSIWGTEDTFATEAKIRDKAPYLPQSTEYVKLEGANHSQFGHYGFQKNDGVATLSHDEQMEKIVASVIKFIKAQD